MGLVDGRRSCGLHHSTRIARHSHRISCRRNTSPHLVRFDSRSRRKQPRRIGIGHRRSTNGTTKRSEVERNDCSVSCRRHVSTHRSSSSVDSWGFTPCDARWPKYTRSKDPKREYVGPERAVTGMVNAGGRLAAALTAARRDRRCHDRSGEAAGQDPGPSRRSSGAPSATIPVTCPLWELLP